MAVADSDLVFLTRNHYGGTASAPGQSGKAQDPRLLRRLALGVGHREANEGAWGKSSFRRGAWTTDCVWAGGEEAAPGPGACAARP